MAGTVNHVNTVEPLMKDQFRNQSEVVVREGWLWGRGLLASIHF